MRRFPVLRLLAEDERAVRLVTRKMLENLGFTVIEAVDGRAAVGCYVDNPHAFDIVVLDMTMPEMSGREAFKEIRRANANQRILFVSGYSRQTDDPGARDPLTEFLQKPFARNDLAAVLERMMMDEAITA